jgi:transglutaminase-like putative cysteine protease
MALLVGLTLLGSPWTGPSARGQDAPAAEPQVREAWDAIYMGAGKIGHSHIKVEPVKARDGRDLYRVQVNTVLEFLRGKDRVAMEVRYGTIETPEGTVLRLDTRTRAGKDEIRSGGDVTDGVMNLSLEVGGKKVVQQIPWGDDVRGPYAAEMSLSRKPMQPGESRDVRTFIPDLNLICTTHLKAVGVEKVTLGGGVVRDLLRVDSTLTDPKDQPMPDQDSTLWIDTGGQLLKTRVALMGGIESYRTTREAAMATNDSVDLMAATIVKVPRPIANPETTRQVQYRVTVEGDDAARVFPADQRQQATPASPGQPTTLIVTTDRPAAGSPDLNPLDPETLAANPIVNSDDPTVIAHTRKAIGVLQDPWQKAVAIQAWVFQNMKRKNFSNAFAAAREVARNLEGDCSEHSVLTAAMCRAAGIPCRMVVGLVYAKPLGGFGPHAWNEVFVNGRWVAIDSAFNQSEVDATHLKLATTSLAGVAPFETFLPVARVFNKLTIEPVEVR